MEEEGKGKDREGKKVIEFKDQQSVSVSVILKD